MSLSLSENRKHRILFEAFLFPEVFLKETSQSTLIFSFIDSPLTSERQSNILTSRSTVDQNQNEVKPGRLRHY